jgi:copper oxidase (laccase) domain-containing protein
VSIELELGAARVLFGSRSVDVRADPDAFGPVRQGHQVHGTTVLRDASGEADGFVSTDPAWGALVRTADCLPIALVGPAGVAMLHAGWRGLAAGIVPAGLAELGEVTAAALGPSARACCYEVGEEVHARFAAYDARRGDNLALDAIATAQLEGIEVVDTGVCTICDERFFSHRREGERAGRQGNVAWPS